MEEHIHRWMQKTLGTTDQAEAARIIRGAHSDVTINERHENRLYHAEIGRKGHGIGLSAEEALIDAARDAYFKPFIRDLEDLKLWRGHQKQDLDNDVRSGELTQSLYESTMTTIEATYQERYEQLLARYPDQVAILSSDAEK
jgi:hypothetical protein